MWIRDLQEENGHIWDWIYKHKRQLDIEHTQVLAANMKIQQLEVDLLKLLVQSLGVQWDFEHFIEDHWHSLQGLIWDISHHLPQHCLHYMADGGPYFGPCTWGFNYQGLIFPSSSVHAGPPLSSSSCPSLHPNSPFSSDSSSLSSPFSCLPL